MKWIVATMVLIVLVAVGIAGVIGLNTGLPVQTATADEGEIRQYVDERGETRLPRTHLITMPYAGRLEAIELESGDKVMTDVPVARIVQKDLENEVAEAEAVVARLNAAIAEKGNLDLEQRTLAQARLMVEAARGRIKASLARMNFAEGFLAKTQRLEGTGARTDEDVDRAEVQAVETKVEYAEDNLTLRIIEILPGIVDAYIGDQQRGEKTLQEEKLEAEARLRQMQIKQERGTMHSPVDGVVLEKHIENERYLAAGEVLLEIGQLDQLEVEADVLSQDVVAVHPGQQVEIYGPAIGAAVGNGVKGTVKKIDPAGFTKVSSLGVEQQRVKVVIAFNEGVLSKLMAERDLGVGYRVRVRIFTDRASGIIVPRSAVFRGPDGNWQLFAVRVGRARRVNVLVGLINDQEVQILDGIVYGERVVLAPSSNLEDGTRVRNVSDEQIARHVPGLGTS